MRKNHLLKILKLASSSMDDRNEGWCSIGPAVISSVESGEPVGGAKILQIIESLNKKVEEGPSKEETDQLIKDLKNMSPDELKEMKEIISSGGNTSPEEIRKEESLFSKKLEFNDTLFKVASLYAGNDFAKDVMLSWSEYSRNNIIKISSYRDNNFNYNLNNFYRFIDDKNFEKYVTKRKHIVKEALELHSPKAVLFDTIKDFKLFAKHPFIALGRFISILGLIMDIISAAEEAYNLIMESKEVLESYTDILTDGSSELSTDNMGEALKTVFDSDYLIEKANKFKNEPEKMLRLVDFVKIVSQIRASLIRFFGSLLNACTFLIDAAGPIGVAADIAASVGIWVGQENAVVSYAGEGLSIVLNKIKEIAQEQIEINCGDTKSEVTKKEDKKPITDNELHNKAIEDIFSTGKDSVPPPNNSMPEDSDESDYIILKEKSDK